MKSLHSLFETTTDLSFIQMVLRGVIVFIFALLILRIAGKRTFGKQSVSDNVIMIMLGAILSRAVSGASPFLPTLGCGLAIVLFHRFITWLCLYWPAFGKMLKGEKVILYKDGSIDTQNLKDCLLSYEDLMEGIRVQINKDEFSTIKNIFLEDNGEISVVKN